MSNDIEEIDALLGNITSHNADSNRYMSYDWTYLTELTNNAQTTGQLQFDSDQAKASWVDWKHAYIYTQINATLTGTAACPPPSGLPIVNGVAMGQLPNIALKNPGTPGLIHSANISLNDKQITQSNFLGVKTNLDILLQSSTVWQETMGPLLNFRKDGSKTIINQTMPYSYMRLQKGMVMYSAADVPIGVASAADGIRFRLINVQPYSSGAAIVAGVVPAVYLPYFDVGDLTNVQLTSAAGVAAQNVAIDAAHPVGTTSNLNDVTLQILNNSGVQINAGADIPSNSLPQVNGIPVILPTGFKMIAAGNIANGAYGSVQMQFCNNTGAIINAFQDIPTQLLPYALSTSLDVGFSNRAKYLQINPGYTVTGGTVATFSFNCVIPLMYIHEFFQAIDQPLLNARFRFLFTSSFSSSTNLYSPIQTDLANSINGTSPIRLSFAPLASRLYYPIVRFTPKVGTAVSDRIASRNLKCTWKFNDFNTYINSQGVLSVPTLPSIVSASQTKPVKLWILLFDAGAMLQQNRNEPGLATQQITGLNVTFGGQNFFQNDMVVPYEIYEVFRQNLPDGGSSHQLGSLINYSDFINQYAIYCIDLTRRPEYVNEAVDKVALGVKGSRISTAINADYLFICEYEKIVTYDLSSGSGIVQVKE